MHGQPDSSHDTDGVTLIDGDADSDAGGTGDGGAVRDADSTADPAPVADADGHPGRTGRGGEPHADAVSYPNADDDQNGHANENPDAHPRPDADTDGSHCHPDAHAITKLDTHPQQDAERLTVGDGDPDADHDTIAALFGDG